MMIDTHMYLHDVLFVDEYNSGGCQHAFGSYPALR